MPKMINIAGRRFGQLNCHQTNGTTRSQILRSTEKYEPNASVIRSSHVRPDRSGTEITLHGDQHFVGLAHDLNFVAPDWTPMAVFTAQIAHAERGHEHMKRGRKLA